MTVKIQKPSSSVKIFLTAMKEDAFIRYMFLFSIGSVLGLTVVAVVAFFWIPIIIAAVLLGVAAFILGDTFLTEYRGFSDIYRREEGRIIANQKHAAHQLI